MLNSHSHERYYSFALSCMRRCCASVGLSSGLIWFLFFNLVSARPVLSVMVSPVEFVFVCAGLWLLCCSCFGGVSPVQLVFSVCCDCRWILVSICECAASLQSILDRLLFISMESIFTTVKIISGGDHKFQFFIWRHWCFQNRRYYYQYRHHHQYCRQ